jgi:hypothetical protein
MRPEAPDLSLLERLGFERPPVGAKFFFERPLGVQRLEKTLALWRERIVEMLRREAEEP